MTNSYRIIYQGLNYLSSPGLLPQMVCTIPSSVNRSRFSRQQSMSFRHSEIVQSSDSDRPNHRQCRPKPKPRKVRETGFEQCTPTVSDSKAYLMQLIAAVNEQPVTEKSLGRSVLHYYKSIHSLRSGVVIFLSGRLLCTFFLAILESKVSSFLLSNRSYEEPSIF